MNASTISSNILIKPLQDDANSASLKMLSSVISTSLGHKGKLKLVQNVSGGCSTITSSSRRLLERISARSIVSRVVISSALSQLKAFNDNGLLCALLTLNMIDSAPLEYPMTSVGELYGHLGKMYVDCLTSKSNPCVFDVNFSNLTHLRSLVDSVLSSKPGCTLTTSDRNHLCNLLLRAFVSVIPSGLLDNENVRGSGGNVRPYNERDVWGCDDTNLTVLNNETAGILDNKNLKIADSWKHMNIGNRNIKASDSLKVRILNDGNVRFYFSGGMSVKDSCLHDGLLIKVPETILWKVKGMGPLKTVLFGTSLVGEVPGEVLEGTSSTILLETLLGNMESVLEKVIAAGVQIVFCQKVIHPRLKKQLQNAEVLVLDKLGSETAKHVQYISGGSSNSSLFSEVKYGSISHIRKQTIGQDQYLLLCNNNNALYSLVICNFCEESGQELMVVCRQAIDMLFRVLKSPRVCFGAGCTEIYTAHLLAGKVQENLSEIQEVTGCSQGEVFSVLRSFLSSLTTTCVSIHQGSRMDFTTETTFNHLWSRTKDRCACGCFSSQDVSEGSWRLLSDGDGFLMTAPAATFSTTRVQVLDEHSCKVGSSSRAIEAAALLLKTALIINSSPRGDFSCRSGLQCS